MKGRLLLALVLLAGCDGGATEPPIRDTQPGLTAPESGSPSGKPRGVRSIEGEWRVAGIDGQPFDEPYGLALSIDADTIAWGPACAHRGRVYTLRSGDIEVGPLDPPVEPPCAVDAPPRLAEVWRALDMAEGVVRTPENGIRFSGGGHSLLIFSQ